MMPHYIVPACLGEQQAARLLSYAVTEEARFKVTKVFYEGDSEGRLDGSFRRSLVLRDLGPFGDLLRDRALALHSCIETTLGTGHFPTPEVEIELVAHGDGAFYRMHTDSQATS